jgi:hypothetical protein
MSDQPVHLKVAKDDIVAAMERDDYQWLVDNVFVPTLVDMMGEEHTAALLNGSTLPRPRRPVGPRRHRNHRTRRSHEFRP